LPSPSPVSRSAPIADSSISRLMSRRRDASHGPLAVGGYPLEHLQQQHVAAWASDTDGSDVLALRQSDDPHASRAHTSRHTLGGCRRHGPHCDPNSGPVSLRGSSIVWQDPVAAIPLRRLSDDPAPTDWPTSGHVAGPDTQKLRMVTHTWQGPEDTLQHPPSTTARHRRAALRRSRARARISGSTAGLRASPSMWNVQRSDRRQ
jgi:hypothetical protein